MKLLLAILFLALASTGEATERWASPTGSGSTCSSGTPCSVTTAISQLVAGDSLRLKNGTYTTISVTNPLPSGISASQPTCMIGESRSGVQIVPSSATGAVTILLNANRSNICFKDMTFDGVNQSSSASSKYFLQSNTSAVITGLVIDNVHVRRYGINKTACDNGAAGGSTGLVLGNATDNFTLSNSTFDQNGCTNEAPDGERNGHGAYIRGSNGIVEHNQFTNNNARGIQFYSSLSDVTNNIFRYNYVSGNEDGVHIGSGANNQAYNNIVVNNDNRGLELLNTAKAYNNTMYGNGIGIVCGGSAVLINNISLGNTTNKSGTCGTETTNRVAGTATDFMISPSTGNFSLKETPNDAIDGGTVISGFSTGRYVGAGVDQGALESCIRNKSVVENDEPTHYHTSYDCPIQSALNNVTLQTPTVGNWAIAVAGVTKTLGNGGLVSAAISGQTTVEVVLASAVTAKQSLTDAMTRSAAPTLTDNVGIGDCNTTCLHAQVRTHAATSGTNNVDAAPSHVVVQSRYRFHKLRGAENAAVVQCATCLENVPITLPPGAAFRLRVKFRSDDDVGSVYNLRYSATLPGDSPTAYTLTPDAMGAHFISWYGVTADTDIPAAGTPTTELLTSDEANLACAVVRTSSDYPFLALNNSETECEYVLKISTSAPVGTTYDFRIYDGSGAAIDTYTNTPRLTVGSYTMLES